MKYDSSLYKSPTYNSWDSMRWRVRGHPRHKGRYLCERWLKFANFFEDMGIRPEGTTLDRIDNTKGYFPGNCRWATIYEQQNNTKANKFIEYMGEKLTIAQWERKLGFKEGVLRARIRRGWGIQEAITKIPDRNVRKRRSRRGPDESA